MVDGGDSRTLSFHSSVQMRSSTVYVRGSSMSSNRSTSAYVEAPMYRQRVKLYFLLLGLALLDVRLCQMT